MHALALFAPRCRRDHAELCTREATERRMSEVLAEMRKQDRTLKDKLRSLRTRHESGRTERDRELAALRRESDVKERPAQ